MSHAEDKDHTIQDLKDNSVIANEEVPVFAAERFDFRNDLAAHREGTK